MKWPLPRHCSSNVKMQRSYRKASYVSYSAFFLFSNDINSGSIESEPLHVSRPKLTHPKSFYRHFRSSIQIISKHTMQKSQEVVTLRAYKPFLTFLSAYKANNFRNIDDRSVLCVNILRAVGVTLLMIMNAWFSLVQLMVFINCKFDLNIGGAQFSFFLCCAPVFCLHFVLIYKINEVIATIEYLHTIVREREFFFLKIFQFSPLIVDYFSTIFLQEARYLQRHRRAMRQRKTNTSASLEY